MAAQLSEMPTVETNPWKDYARFDVGDTPDPRAVKKVSSVEYERF